MGWLALSNCTGGLLHRRLPSPLSRPRLGPCPTTAPWTAAAPASRLPPSLQLRWCVAGQRGAHLGQRCRQPHHTLHGGVHRGRAPGGRGSSQPGRQKTVQHGDRAQAPHRAPVLRCRAAAVARPAAQGCAACFSGLICGCLLPGSPVAGPCWPPSACMPPCLPSLPPCGSLLKPLIHAPTSLYFFPLRPATRPCRPGRHCQPALPSGGQRGGQAADRRCAPGAPLRTGGEK